MADHPLLHGPRVGVPMDAVKVNEPVEVGLQVVRLHAREAVNVPPDPRAQVVHEPHLLEVDGVGGVGFVALVDEAELPHERVVRLLAAVDQDRALLYVALQGGVYPLRRGLAVLADHGQGLAPRVDGDDHADLVPGKAVPPAGARLAPRAGVREVHLVDPDPAGEDDAVLPAADGREDLVPPQERRRVADPADQLDEAQRGVEAHDLDDHHDLVQRELRVGEYRPAQGVEPPAAIGAPEPAAPIGGRAVEPGPLAPAARAPRRAAPLLHEVLDRVRAVLLAAAPRLDRVLQHVEVLVAEAVDEKAQVQGIAVHASSGILGSRPDGHLPGCRQTKKKMAFRTALFGGGIIS